MQINIPNCPITRFSCGNFDVNDQSKKKKRIFGHNNMFLLPNMVEKNTINIKVLLDLNSKANVITVTNVSKFSFHICYTNTCI